jgi:hypothetical protein
MPSFQTFCSVFCSEKCSVSILSHLHFYETRGRKVWKSSSWTNAIFSSTMYKKWLENVPRPWRNIRTPSLGMTKLHASFCIVAGMQMCFRFSWTAMARQQAIGSHNLQEIILSRNVGYWLPSDGPMYFERSKTKNLPFCICSHHTGFSMLMILTSGEGNQLAVWINRTNGYTEGP